VELEGGVEENLSAERKNPTAWRVGASKSGKKRFWTLFGGEIQRFFATKSGKLR